MDVSELLSGGRPRRDYTKQTWIIGSAASSWTLLLSVNSRGGQAPPKWHTEPASVVSSEVTGVNWAAAMQGKHEDCFCTPPKKKKKKA